VQDDLLASLNDVQREVVTYSDGPVLVLAGAGSGKTRAVTHKVAHLLKVEGYRPHSVLSVTFTNKAAGEMRGRLRRLVGPPAEGLSMGTFHSICARLLRRHAELIGYTNSFIIYDADDTRVLFRQVVNELDLDRKKFAYRLLASVYDSLRSRGTNMDAWAGEADGSSAWRPIALRAFKKYEEKKVALNAMDFTDLLARMLQVLRENEDVRRSYHERYQYVLVDEMQDTNRMQLDLLRHLVGPHLRICAVGDDDQSIYGWRGARVENMLDFEKAFPGARVLRMEQNYRSTPVILDAAHSVIRNNSRRRDKKLWTNESGGERLLLITADSEGDEAARVSQLVKSLYSEEATPYRNMAVFYRTNAQSRSFEERFAAEQVPHVVVGGMRFYERAEVKDALGYLRVLYNPRDDVSFTRIVNNPPRGIGKGALDRLAMVAFERGSSLYEAGLTLLELDEPEKWQRTIGAFISRVEGWRQQVELMSIADLQVHLLQDSGYLARLEGLDSVEAESRLENLDQLVSAIKEFEEREESPSLQGYLEQVALITDIDLWNDEYDRVPLMTVHAAKGLEFDVVFVTGMEERLFPHANHSEDWELEEERRLFYVALTRARRRVVITNARTRLRFGETSRPDLSRFVTEIDSELLDEVGSYSRRSFAQASASGGAGKGGLPYRKAPRRRTTVKPAQVTADLAGSFVVHPEHGRGKVLAVVGGGKDKFVVVKFRDNMATVRANTLKVES